MAALLKHWQLIFALAAVAGTGLAQQVEIENLKEQQQQLQEMPAQAARVDERTKNIQQEQQEQKAILIDILREMRTR